MTPADVMVEGYARIGSTARAVLEGVDAPTLTWRPDAEANPIAWLVWHAARVQDDHLAEVAGREQAWTAQGWVERFGLPLETEDTGYGHTSEQVASVHVSDPDLLLGYLEAVLESSRSLLSGLHADDLDEVVDRSWDPPVTLGVRLVSVLDDSLQHLGQAAYLRGMAERSR